MSEDNFRKNVYEVLKAVEAKTMSLSVAQRRIMRLARCVTPNKSAQADEAVCTAKYHVALAEKGILILRR